MGNKNVGGWGTNQRSLACLPSEWCNTTLLQVLSVSAIFANTNNYSRSWLQKWTFIETFVVVRIGLPYWASNIILLIGCLRYVDWCVVLNCKSAYRCNSFIMIFDFLVLHRLYFYFILFLVKVKHAACLNVR